MDIAADFYNELLPDERFQIVVVTAIAVAVFAIAMAIRWLASILDRQRIVRYLLTEGAEPVRIRWAPLGPGALRERASRIYRVDYIDADGVARKSFCKTSLLGGVYWTRDT